MNGHRMNWRARAEREWRMARYDDSRLPPMHPVPPAPIHVPHVAPSLIALVLIFGMAAIAVKIAAMPAAALIAEVLR